MRGVGSADGATIWAHVLPLLALGLEPQAAATDSGALVVNEPAAHTVSPA